MRKSMEAMERNIYVMVEIFKTNVKHPEESEKILQSLNKKFPSLKINFDLDDCDNILRVEGKNILVEDIIMEMKSKKCSCALLL